MLDAPLQFGYAVNRVSSMIDRFAEWLVLHALELALIAVAAFFVARALQILLAVLTVLGTGAMMGYATLKYYVAQWRRRFRSRRQVV